MHIEELDGQIRFPDGWSGDIGGPDSRGPLASVHFGSRFPFVIGMYGRIYGISGTGDTTLLFQNGSAVPENLTHNRPRSRRITFSGADEFRTGDGTRSGGSPAMAACTSLTVFYERCESGAPAKRNFRLRRSHSPFPPYYNGAWIVEQFSQKPATLLRHTIANGIETFWTSERGRQIHALHAGSDGNSLLILAERGYNGDSFDLALWRVGDPAPPMVDYVRVLVNGRFRGFVRLNVDGLAGGEPFVFDTGIRGEDNTQANRILRQDVVRGTLSKSTRRRSAGH